MGLGEVGVKQTWESRRKQGDKDAIKHRALGKYT